ncbi:hypothetical protein [Bosea sp. Root670]|uniref:hypothetical protein n=1 Tax=Bosea sp. Root670 TaxID=1736583 RepID=UPI000ACE50E4|nr:hypothetical protein [Bosea sp. Root670]
MKDIEDGEVVVMIRHKVKVGGELMATYRMEYPDLATALRQIASDLKDGRVEAMWVGVRQLTDEEVKAGLCSERSHPEP